MKINVLYCTLAVLQFHVALIPILNHNFIMKFEMLDKGKSIDYIAE